MGLVDKTKSLEGLNSQRESSGKKLKALSVPSNPSALGQFAPSAFSFNLLHLYFPYFIVFMAPLITHIKTISTVNLRAIWIIYYQHIHEYSIAVHRLRVFVASFGCFP